jgi:cytochrome c553
MTSLSKAATDAEVAAAAAYFSALKPKSTIRVVEIDTVPTSYVAGWFLAALKTGDKEPIGQRIIEVPEDLEQFDYRDTHARFIAYVPVGSIAKGEVLVKSGGSGKTIQCAICHGPDLKGLGAVPRIAGRSPSYNVRQLYDIKHGARAGVGSALMKEVVNKLSEDDMVAIAAYLAAQAP